MGMSTCIVGFVPPDEKWDKMKTIYNACVAADIEIPTEVDKYFDYNNPNKIPGLEINIEHLATDYTDDDLSCEGVELDLSKLPEKIKFIRFYNSY